MSKTGAILIETTLINKDIYENILITLLNNGWKIEFENKISFMLDGSYEWSFSDPKNHYEVLEKVKTSIDKKLETSIELTWGNSSMSIGVTYLDSKKLMFSIIGNQQKIALIDIVDFSWYIEKLIPVFDIIGYVRIRCTYD